MAATPMPGPAPAMALGPAPALLASPAAYGPTVGVERPAELEPQGVALPTLKQWFRSYETAKVDEIREQRDARLYYHGSQWTDEELAELRRRGQPPIVNNRISLKIDGIVGVVDRLRMDPKATARTQAYAAGAEIGTAALREVLDKNRWEALRQEVSQDLAIVGVGGTERDVEMDSDGQPNTVLRRVDPETWWYDPRSVRADFSDARFYGVYKWLDLDAAIEMLPNREAQLRAAVSRDGADTLAQKDWEKNWYDAGLERVKLVEVWYRQRGQWRYAIHTGDAILEEGVSPFVDSRGKSRSKYNMASAGIDQDGDRYGFVRHMKSAQDEINHRRSKLLWILNVNQVFAEEGAVEDPNKTKRELGRPDAWITYNPSVTGGGKPFEIRDQSQQMQGQAELLNEAKAEIDNFGPNPALLGSGPASASGRAQALQQQAGIAQLGPYFGRFKAWKLGLYRDIWDDVRQLWTNERVLRVAGPEEMQFVPVNTLVMTPQGPRIANAIGELDLDIVMDEGPDTVTLHEDNMQILDSLIQKGLLAGPGALPVVAAVANWAPSLKQQLMQANAPPQPTPEQMQEQAVVKQLQLRDAAAKIAKTEADATRAQADAFYKQVQAENLGEPEEVQAIENADRIVDMAHKQARTRQINQQTAVTDARMGMLGVPAAGLPLGF